MPHKMQNDQLDDVFSDLKDDPEFQEALAALEPGYQVAHYRLSKGLTQTELAELAGTSQPSIARLENGAAPPSLSFLTRVARAMDARVEIRLVSNAGPQPGDEDHRALFTTIDYLHDDALEDFKRGKFDDASQKLNTLLKLIEKCQPTQEIGLISEMINREKKLLDQFDKINIQHSLVQSTV